MKSEDLMRAVGEIDDDLIAEAHEKPKVRRNPAKILSFAAVAACACLCLVISLPLLIGMRGASSKDEAVKDAEDGISYSQGAPGESWLTEFSDKFNPAKTAEGKNRSDVPEDVASETCETETEPETDSEKETDERN